MRVEKSYKLLPFAKTAYKKWTEEEVAFLKDSYIQGLAAGEKKRLICEKVALNLGRSSQEVLKKLYRLYGSDEDLRAFKSENWSKEKILDSLKQIYLEGKPLNKSALPRKLNFILLKVCKPTAPSHRCFFESQDHALAEAVLGCGYARNDDGTLDVDFPIETLEDAFKYVKTGIKKRHEWTLDEVRNILRILHEADYPITLPFLTNHFSIYKDRLKTNRKLESFKDVIKKFINDGSIESYPGLVCSIAPNYRSYYNEDCSRLRLSTEEIRVKHFLDRWKIPYIVPRLSDKLPTNLEGYQNFVPDFIILDKEGIPTAIVEVFGSIGDRLNADINQIYGDKTEAKIKFYKQIPDIGFIEVWNNQGRCDLDDDSLFQKFSSFIPRFSPLDLETIIVRNSSKVQDKLAKYGCAILQEDSGFRLITSRQNFKFDSLMEIPVLKGLDGDLKRFLDLIITETNKPKYHRKQKHPSEHVYDYQPLDKDIYNDSNRQVSVQENTNNSGVVG